MSRRMFQAMRRSAAPKQSPPKVAKQAGVDVAHQTVSESFYGYLNAIADGELVHDVPYMGLYSFAADYKTLGYLDVGQPFHQQLQNIAFSLEVAIRSQHQP